MTEHKISIDTYKLNFLFHNLVKVKCTKNSMAKRLRISTATLDEYLSLGDEYMNKYEELLEPILYIDTSHIKQEYEDNRFDIKEQFMEKNGLSNIGDKYKNTFDSHFYWSLEKDKEEYIYKQEKEYLATITFSENKAEDKKIKTLILFRKIWDRAIFAVEDFLYSNVDKALPSTKHANLNMRFIEKLSPEDWAEKPKQLEVKGNVQHNIGSFAHLANLIQEQRMQLEDKGDIIDAEYENIESETQSEQASDDA